MKIKVRKRKINIAQSVDGEFVINNKIIEDEIFDEEMVNYRFEEREEHINNLISWTAEALHKEPESRDVYLMKTDLLQLMNLKEKYVLSNINTNEYLSQEKEEDRFTEVCLEILEANNKFLLDNGKKLRKTNDSTPNNELGK